VTSEWILYENADFPGILRLRGFVRPGLRRVLSRIARIPPRSEMVGFWGRYALKNAVRAWVRPLGRAISHLPAFVPNKKRKKRVTV